MTTSPNRILLLLGAMAMASLIALSHQQANDGDAFDKGVADVLSTVFQAACTIAYQSEFEECKNQVRNVSTHLPNQENDKELCCSYVAYRDCVKGVASKHCGKLSTQITDKTMSAFSESHSPVAQCTEYTNWWECTDTSGKVGVVIVSLLIVAAVILVVWCAVKVCCLVCSKVCCKQS